jgi:hypothetical protein
VIRAIGTKPDQLTLFSPCSCPTLLASVEAMQAPASEVHRFGLALQIGASHGVLLLRGSVFMSVNLLPNGDGQVRFAGALFHNPVWVVTNGEHAALRCDDDSIGIAISEM